MNKSGNGQSDGAVYFGVFILICAIIAGVIYIAKILFPIVGVLSIILLIALIVSLFLFQEASLYIGIAFLVCLLATGGTYLIAYPFANSAIGQTSTQVTDAVNTVNDAVSDATYQAMMSVVDTNCQTLSEQDCNRLKLFVKTAKTAQEVSDFADQLQTAKKLADKVTK